MPVHSWIVRLRSVLANDEKRIQTQQSILLLCLGAISAVMTVLNVFTHKGVLTWATLIFALLCVLNYWLHKRGGVCHKIAMLLFCIEIIVLFSFFAITGNPDGFSVLWIALLPSFGLLLFRKKYGSLFSFFVFLMLAFFFWSPLGNSLLQYDYGETFRMRFPVLYVAFFVIAFFLELVRDFTYEEMKRAKNRYSFLYSHDALTGVCNRYGFQHRTADLPESSPDGFALALFDVDHFKKINDNFGHQNGDRFLKMVIQCAKDVLGDSSELVRWGGDEFVILFRRAEEAPALSQAFLEAVRETVFHMEESDLQASVSIGLVCVGKDEPFKIDAVLKQADENLYLAKDGGRNRLIHSDYKTD